MLILELLAAVVFLAARPAGAPPEPTLRTISLGGARTDVLLARVDAAMAEAVVVVERFWGSDWEREIVVVATDSDARFAEQAHLDPNRQWTDIAAVAVADEVDLTQRRAIGQRIVLAPGAVGMSDEALRIVLTHELFHFAARADTALDAPRWLTEGVADFVARRPTPVPRTTQTALPSDAELDMTGPDRSAGYDRAWWFARFVADRYGVDALRRLYERACGPGHPDLPTAIREVLGTDLAGLSAQWSLWLRR